MMKRTWVVAGATLAVAGFTGAGVALASDDAPLRDQRPVPAVQLDAPAADSAGSPAAGDSAGSPAPAGDSGTGPAPTPAPVPAPPAPPADSGNSPAPAPAPAVDSGNSPAPVADSGNSADSAD